MTISDELLEKYLLGDATLFEVSQVKHAAENDPELAERLLVSGRFDKMMEDEEFEELPLQRMAAASQLLSGTDLSVTEIAERSGYSSIEHFSAAFHRQMGCSPRAYRKGQREQDGL